MSDQYSVIPKKLFDDEKMKIIKEKMLSIGYIIEEDNSKHIIFKKEMPEY